MDEEKRKNQISKVSYAGRELSTWTVLYHQCIADQVGLSVTDHKCLEILVQNGAMTAGQLADFTGLTTGAITGVIDRLEKAGFACRERDARDRRKVIVQPNLVQAHKNLGPLFASLQQEINRVLTDYTDAEIDVIVKYIQKSSDLLREQIAVLRKNLPNK
jgi:DNA-binding MarR family transcriptional regulator